jgi:hypothetical protein
VLVWRKDWDFAFFRIADVADSALAKCGDEKALFSWKLVHDGMWISERPEGSRKIAAGISLEGDDARSVVGEIDSNHRLTLGAVVDCAIGDALFFHVKSHTETMSSFPKNVIKK